LIAAILVEKFANYIFRCNKVKYIWPMGKFPKKGNSVWNDSTYSQDLKYL
jgi:hypothetical protein